MLVAGAALSLIAPIGAQANDINFEGMNSYSRSKSTSKKLKKFNRVFFIYGGIYLVNLIIVVIIGINRNNFFIFNYNFRNV